MKTPAAITATLSALALFAGPLPPDAAGQEPANQAVRLTVEWDLNPPHENVVAYVLLAGPTTNTMAPVLEVGATNRAHYTVPIGSTNWIALKARNSIGLESLPSAPVPGIVARPSETQVRITEYKLTVTLSQ